MTTAARARGRLIAVEGIDGAGKSTFVRRFRSELRRRGLRVLDWHEPVDRALGAQAQSAALTDPWTSALLFTLDRARGRAQLERALAHADVVLADRSFYSTLAYQGSALDPTEAGIIRRLQLRATIRPDRVLWLKLDPRIAMERLRGRSRRRDPLERQATLKRVARAYSDLARGPRWVTLDARLPSERLAEQVARQLGRSLARRPRR